MIAKVVSMQGVSFPVTEALAKLLARKHKFDEGRHHHKRDKMTTRGWRREDANLLALCLDVETPTSAARRDGPGDIDVLVFAIGGEDFLTPCNRQRAVDAAQNKELAILVMHDQRGFWLAAALEES